MLPTSAEPADRLPLSSLLLTPDEALLHRAAQTAQQNAARRAATDPQRLRPPPLRPVVTQEKVEQMERRRADAEQAERAAVCVSRARIPPKYRNASLGDVASVPPADLDGYRAVVAQVEAAISTPGIYALIGDVGPGKTHMACGLVNAFCRNGRSARYMKAFDYIQGLRSTWRSNEAGAENRFEQEHVRLSLLVLDEWQMRGDTENENHLLLRMIDKRYDASVTTLLVANYLNREEFMQSIDARINDRMYDGGGVIECKWESLRGRLVAP